MDERTRRMWQLAEALQAVSELVSRRSAGVGGDPASMRVLAILLQEGPKRPSELAEGLALSPAAMTRRAKALEEAGHIAVRPDLLDARSYRLDITETGREALAQLATTVAASMSERLQGWSDRDVDTLIRLLRRMTTDAAEPSAQEPAPARGAWWQRAHGRADDD